VGREILRSIDVDAALDHSGVEQLHFQLDVLGHQEKLGVQSSDVSEVLVELPVEGSLAHLLQGGRVLFCQGVNESSISIEENGMLCIVVVDLLLQAPSPEHSEPALHVVQVPAFVDQVISRITEQLIILLLDLLRVFLRLSVRSAAKETILSGRKQESSLL